MHLHLPARLERLTYPHVSTAESALLLPLPTHPATCRRLVLLQLLAQRLPAALAALCADTLAFVNFACGAVATDAPSCACCCELEDSADEEEQGHSGDSCSSGRRGSGDGGAGPSTAMPLPVQAPHGVARDDDNPSCGNTDSEGSPSCSASTEKQTQAEALLPRPRLGGCASALPQHGQRPCSKALAAAVAGDSGGLEMHGLTLRFHSQLAEKEFGALRNPFYVAASALLIRCTSSGPAMLPAVRSVAEACGTARQLACACVAGMPRCQACLADRPAACRPMPRLQTDSVAALLMLAAMVAVSFMQVRQGGCACCACRLALPCRACHAAASRLGLPLAAPRHAAVPCQPANPLAPGHPLTAALPGHVQHLAGAVAGRRHAPPPGLHLCRQAGGLAQPPE